MIYDRTAIDVQNALQIRREVIQAGGTPTTAQLETLARGMLSIDTLNRIEAKQAELADTFTALGYYNSGVSTKTWDYTDIFTGEDFTRILHNADILRRAFFTYSNTPETPTAKYHYANLNALEKILADMDTIADALPSDYRICGDYVCGEEQDG